MFACSLSLSDRPGLSDDDDDVAEAKDGSRQKDRNRERTGQAGRQAGKRADGRRIFWHLANRGFSDARFPF